MDSCTDPRRSQPLAIVRVTCAQPDSPFQQGCTSLQRIPPSCRTSKIAGGRLFWGKESTFPPGGQPPALGVLHKILQSVGQQFRSPMNSCGLFQAFQMTPTVETTFATSVRHWTLLLSLGDRCGRSAKEAFSCIHLGFLWTWAEMQALPRSAAPPLTTLCCEWYYVFYEIPIVSVLITSTLNYLSR